jgi:hypothetical protein
MEFLCEYTNIPPNDFQFIYDIVPFFMRCTAGMQDIFRIKDQFDKESQLLNVKCFEVATNPCVKTCVILDTRRLFQQLIDAEFEGVEEGRSELFLADVLVEHSCGSKCFWAVLCL